MQLFYAPDIITPLGFLPEEESRHAVRVLRLTAGDRLYVTDGKGRLFEAEVVVADPRRCEVRVVETFTAASPGGFEGCFEPSGRLTMAVAPTKNSDRYEWFLEKATEIGVSAFVPIECANSERRVVNLSRCERVISSAMKQSLKAYVPVLEPLTGIGELIGRPFEGVKLIAHCRAEIGGVPGRVPIVEALPQSGDVMIMIGPEGDFTAAEVEMAVAKGFIPVSLGESRMRTETAAIFATVAWRISESNR